MSVSFRCSPLLAVLVAGCTSMPSGPSVLVLPGTGKTFDQFRADDYECRQYASMQIGGVSPNQAAADSGVKSAAVGTAIGAAAGAAINGGNGAAVGAGTGLLVGAMAGAGAADVSSYTLQQRYDYGYEQCMYAKGHKVPVSGMFTAPRQNVSRTPPPPPPPPPAP
ncbi:MAG TPA: YMGG-like glycine zipper-containing protein [Burkholderiales bacterium]|nr:YMGG-like glycine zipper-containing protein [Burkholderiales bacterium]